MESRCLHTEFGAKVDPALIIYKVEDESECFCKSVATANISTGGGIISITAKLSRRRPKTELRNSTQNEHRGSLALEYNNAGDNEGELMNRFKMRERFRLMESRVAPEQDANLNSPRSLLEFGLLLPKRSSYTFEQQPTDNTFDVRHAHF